MSVEIYLLRHGETEWNLDGRLQGRQDSPLTELGRRQAQRLGELLASHLAGRPLPPFQVSPSGRTQQAANLIRAGLAGLGPSDVPRIEPRLTEVSFGQWEGLTFDEIEAEWEDLIDAYDDLDWLFEAPEGEGYDQALMRVDSWLADQQGSLIAVSHGLVSKLICSRYLGLAHGAVIDFSLEPDVVYHLHDGRIDPIRE